MTRRSGTPTTPNAKRKRVMVTISLSAEGLSRIDELAEAYGTSRSAMIERMGREFRTPKKSL